MNEETNYQEKYLCSIGSLFHDFFASGGGKGGSDANITMTQTNPVVPDDMKALADSLNAIATGQLGAPVNFGAIPGLDAPQGQGQNLVPQPSMGNVFAQQPFQMGMNRMGGGGQGMGGMQRRMPIRRPLPQQNRQPFVNSNNSMGSTFAGR